jgi:hypothetical protein
MNLPAARNSPPLSPSIETLVAPAPAIQGQAAGNRSGPGWEVMGRHGNGGDRKVGKANGSDGKEREGNGGEKEETGKDDKVMGRTRPECAGLGKQGEGKRREGQGKERKGKKTRRIKRRKGRKKRRAVQIREGKGKQ